MNHTLLAMDTSNQHCSVALTHQSVLYELHERAEYKHSETILPLVRRLLEMHQITLSDVDAFVVGVGPGGFTGVRLAVAVTQGLAFAVAKKVAPLSSLLAMAYAAFNKQNSHECVVTVVMDARMQEVYHATYRIDEAGFETLQPPMLSSVTGFMSAQNLWLTTGNYGLVGNAVTVFDEVASWCTHAKVSIWDIDHTSPHASDFMLAAQSIYSKGGCIEPDFVAPLYVRDKIALTTDERLALKAAL